MRWLLLVICFATCLEAGPNTLLASKLSKRDALRFFEAKVRPLLVARCQQCHGEKKQSGGLRVDSLAAIVRGGESGAALKPHDPQESLLISAVKYESLEMPPKGQLSSDEIATLVKWVELGAPWPNADIHQLQNQGRKFSPEDRAYWAFQPLADVSPPVVAGEHVARNEIDSFIGEQLQANHLRPAPAASKRVLLRRAYFDLLGVPPTPEQTAAFLADTSPRAYEQLVDRLLDSPGYGERWGRHWLDLVRYAESDGYKQDAYRPHAWRYRDYVIRSLNADKPYDQFIREQLAGDEIAPHDPEAIAATGYLRHWIYEYNQRDVRTQWQGILNDVTDVTADVFLGLGMGCARCHDHKFDPILRKDYFRLQAFFAAMLPHDDTPIAAADVLTEYHRQQQQWTDATAEIRRQLAAIEEPVYQRSAEPAINKFPPDIRPMMRKAEDERNPLEVQLAAMAYRQVATERSKVKMSDKLTGETKQRWEQLRKQLASYDHLKPKPLPTTFTVRDIGSQAPAVYIPGRTQNPIEPGFLSVLDPAPAKIPTSPSPQPTTGRRTALANWIASPDNPLTTRVIVNRIWQYHFGRGIVNTSSDFGRLGEVPTHPELLDWLARYFIDHDWSWKHLHRLIMTSATYRQAAANGQVAEAEQVDPENQWYWRSDIRRLDAEQIRDAMLQVSGELSPDVGGASVAWSEPRRSIYLKVLRNSYDPLLRAFDGPDNFSSLSERNVTTIPTQSLLLINGDWTLARAQAFARRLPPPANESDWKKTVQTAYQLAYARLPDEDEVDAAQAFLTTMASEPASPPKVTTSLPGRRDAAAAIQTPHQTPLWTLPDTAALPDADFTIEATVLLKSLYPDATVRTIVSQWNNNHQQPGWSLGVTSTKSAYQPRNLILQLIGDRQKGALGYEVIASNLRPKLNKPYYVAVTVDISDTAQTGITFYLQDLSKPDAELQVAHVKHQVTGHFRGSAPFVVGGRHGTASHRWDGLIDDLRLSKTRLPKNRLLIEDGRDKSPDTIGHWTFAANHPERDLTSSHHDLQSSRSTTEVSTPRHRALVDFCHLLLNSNEFIYVD